MQADHYTAVGLMSGTSWDGLDIVLARFSFSPGKRTFHILRAATIPYPSALLKKLTTAMSMPQEALDKLDVELGRFYGHAVKNFLETAGSRADLIASHGHTVYHRPSETITLQIGNGKAIAEITGLPVVNDFRSEDVRKGGQGAPLVPIGDRDLFGEYDFCLNLGGIANLSVRQEKMLAGDVVPCNMVLNALAQETGRQMDRGGAMASGGICHGQLLARLNALPYYNEDFPKSLGREWVEANVFSILASYKDIPASDRLRTMAEHIRMQVHHHLGRHAGAGSVLVTGGGARNDFLVQHLQNNTPFSFVIPSDMIIDYKEALIFAYLGVLRARNEVNVLASVTGAASDSSSGTIITP